MAIEVQRNGYISATATATPSSSNGKVLMLSPSFLARLIYIQVTKTLYWNQLVKQALTDTGLRRND